jgi:hypothetical protein
MTEYERGRQVGVQGFTDAILHGDEAHRQWLRDAAEAFIADTPLPVMNRAVQRGTDREAGVREGIEMAAQWHASEAARMDDERSEYLSGKAFEHRKHAAAIRSLLPAAPKDLGG